MGQTLNTPVMEKEVIIVPLRDGLSSLIKVYESLIDADVDPITGQCSNYSTIRQQIVEAQKSLEQSEQAASAGLSSLDEAIEKLTEEEGKLKQEERDTECILENLKTEQTTNKKLFTMSEGALKQARSELNCKKEALQHLEDRKRHAETITGIGGGLFLIPVIGWIIGGVMVAGGAVELGQVKNEFTAAEQEVKKSESQVERDRKKIEEWKSKIFETECKIEQTRKKVERFHEGIKKVKEKREAVVVFQEKERCAVKLLGTLSGRINAQECQTRRIIVKEPLVKVMEDVLKATEQIAGDQLLYDEGIHKLIDIMREKNTKLAAITV